MNTKLIVLVLGLSVIAVFTLPLIGDVGDVADVILHADSAPSVAVTISEKSKSNRDKKASRVVDLNSLQLPQIEVISVEGTTFLVAEENKAIEDTGVISTGFYKTTTDSFLELRIGSQTRVHIYPETEIEISPMGASWPSVIDFHIHKGEVDFLTTGESGENLRIIVNQICINPLLVNFKVKFNSQTISGEIVVKEGLLRVTSNYKPDRYCTLPTSFRLRFSDGILNYPGKARLEKYKWKL